MGWLKNAAKKLLNPLTPVNALGKVADKIADKTGLGDSLSSSKFGKVANYLLNPIAQTQGARDAGQPVTEFAEKNPQVVKMIGNVVQVVGAGVALVFPPVGAVVSGVGTGIVYASKLIETKNTISTIPEIAKGFQQAIKDKDYKLALLTLSYLATQGENITADLRQLRISAANDGKLAQYQNAFNELSLLSGTGAATIEKANAIYEQLLADYKTSGNAVEKEVKQDDNGSYIAVEISENEPFIVRFLKWFFGF